MSNSPVLWGPRSTSNNLQNQMILGNGELIQNNGAKNYLNFNNFENALTTGWGLGTTGLQTNGIPTSTPTFGSGTVGLTLSAQSSGPIAGTYSLQVAATPTWRSADMIVSDAITIDAGDQAKVLTYKLYYSVPSGASNGNFSGTSSNTLGIAVYDVTNSVWLPMTGNFAITQNSGVGIATGTCQTNITTSVIRFCIYSANTTGGAITFLFDRFFLGPQTAPYGPVVTDPVSYTPTFTGFGTVSAVNFTSWRDGAFLVVDGTFTAGTNTATEARISLGFNGGNSNATTVSTLPTIQLAGKMNGRTAASTTFGGMTVLAEASKSYMTFGTESSTTNGLTKMLGNDTTSTATYSLFARFAITGWSSNVQMSNDTDTRVVSMYATPSSAGSMGTLTSSPSDTVFNTVVSDTHGAYNSSTGVYTIPVTGYYIIQSQINSSGTAAVNTQLLVSAFNATASSVIQTGVVTAGGAQGQITTPLSITSILLSAGTQIKIRSNFNNTYTSGAYAANSSYLSIARLSGPAVIAATDSVNAAYTGTATSLTNNTTITIVYSTKVKDTHNAYSAGTYTIPVSGQYLINASMTIVDAAAVVARVISIKRLGTTIGYAEWDNAAATNSTKTLGAFASYPCNAGDTITVTGLQNTGGNITPNNDTGTQFSIIRVGN